MISVVQLGPTDYSSATDLQKCLVDLRKQGRIGDTLLLLEHLPVITLGRRARMENLLVSRDELTARDIELVECDRGGDITFHGPGQMVAYPIFDLRGFSPRIGAVDFVRRLEEVLIRTCGDLGVPVQRIPGWTGVWTSPAASDAGAADAKKIAAIGVHISRSVTSHGLALNVTTDLRYFDLIVPCGIAGRQVTSLAAEMESQGQRLPAWDEITHALSRNFGRVFARQTLWLGSLGALLPAPAVGLPLQYPEGLRRLHHDGSTLA